MKITLCGAFGGHVRRLCTMVLIRWLTDCFMVFVQDELDGYICKMGGNKSSRTYAEASADPIPNPNLNPYRNPNTNKNVDPNRCYLLCNTAGQNCKKVCELTSSGTAVDPMLPYTTTGWPAAAGTKFSPVGESSCLRSANFIRQGLGHPNAVTLRRVTDMQNPAGCHMEAYNFGGNVFWNNLPGTDIGDKYQMVCEDGTGIPFLAPKGSSHCQDQTGSLGGI